MNKLQHLLINQLQKNGSVKLLLPDGVVVEIGVNQIGQDGELVKVDDYCWVIASREGRSAVLDSYNLGVRFRDEPNALVLEDEYVNDEGEQLRRLDVI